MGSKKKSVDPKFAVKDDQIKVEKFPTHNNEYQPTMRFGQNGTTESLPPDAFSAVRVKGYFDDGSGYAGYEIVAKRFEKEGLLQWVRGKKWETVGYINPRTYKVQWLRKSDWLLDQVGVLIHDIQNYETIMRARVKEMQA